MSGVGQVADPWLPLHEVVKTVLSELGERKAPKKPDQRKIAPALQVGS